MVETTEYKLEVIDNNNLQVISRDSMLVNVASILQVENNDTTICSGDTIRLNAYGCYSFEWSTGSTDNSILFSTINNSTVNVSGFDENGNLVGTQSIHINVFETPAPPQLSFLFPDTILSSSPSNFWTFNHLPLSSTGSFLITDSNGLYGAYYLDSHGCPSTESFYDLQVLNLDESSISNINIFPNPFADILFFQANENIESIEIFSSDGRSIFKDNQLYTKSFVLQSKEISKGIYVVKIIDESKGTFYKTINKTF